MNRVLSLLGVLAAALALIFHFTGVAAGADFLLVAFAVLLIGIGNLTGL